MDVSPCESRDLHQARTKLNKDPRLREASRRVALSVPA